MPRAFTALPSPSLRHALSLNRPASGFNEHQLRRNLSGELDRKEKLVFGGENMFYLKPFSSYFITLSTAKRISGVESHGASI